MKKSDLKKVVDAMKPAFKANDIAEFGKYLFFLKDKAFAYNGAMSIVLSYKSDVEFAVPAVEFTKFLEKVKAEEIELTIGESIDIKAGKATASFAKNDFILNKAKELPLQIPESFDALPKDFVQAMKMCQYSVGKDKSFEALTYLYIHKNRAASTDNYRVSQYLMDNELQNDLYIPGEALRYLISYDVNEYKLADGAIYFKGKDNAVFITRTSNLPFPAYESYMEGTGTELEFPESMKDMVDTASVTVDGLVEVDKNVKIEIFKNVIKVHSENEIGKVVVEEKIATDTEASILINPAFLSTILDITRKVTLCENRMIFSTNNFKHVVALLG